MSSQRGNITRTRPQKHQNRKVFKNDLHDTNIRTKRINLIQITAVCDKCKAILEWKIKYKKYKLMKAPKSCNKCGEKAVKQPYHTICQPCAAQYNVCPKCTTAFEKKNDISEDVNGGDHPLNDAPESIRCNDIDGEAFSDSENSLCDTDDECATVLSKIGLNS